MTPRGPYRRHSTPFKLQLCQEIRAGIMGRRDAQRSHNISANLIQLWLTQFDRGELANEEAEASASRGHFAMAPHSWIALGLQTATGSDVTSPRR